MANFFADNFSNYIFVAVLLVAMFPTLESKVAIPLGLSVAIWGEQVMAPWAAFLTAFLGSLVPAVVVLCLSRFLKNKTAGFVQEKFMSRFNSRKEKILGKSTTFKKCLSIGTFVAVPLPLTGVWTGSLIAGMTNLKLWQCLLSVVLGEIVSCAAILLLCVLFENSAFYVLIASLVLVAAFLVVRFGMFLFSKIKQKRCKTIQLDGPDLAE